MSNFDDMMGKLRKLAGTPAGASILQALALPFFPSRQLGQARARAHFRTGDIVTRGGDDRQLVLRVTEDGFAMDVRCIEAPASGWCKVGDEEYNLCRRYEFVAKAR